MPDRRAVSAKKYTLYCAAAVVLAIVALAPARTLTAFAESPDGVTVYSVSGLWWRGNANLVLRGYSAGELSWYFNPLALFLADLRFDWQLQGADMQLAGLAGIGFGGTTTVEASGEVAAAAINPVLATYHIELPGTFQVDGLLVRVEDDELAVAGTLDWNGGPTNYRLSGRTFEIDMPPMAAVLETKAGQPTLTVRDAADGIRLLVLALDAEGWLRIDVTKRLTDLAGKPWPGTAQDEEVVVSVQEKVAAW